MLDDIVRAYPLVRHINCGLGIGEFSLLHVDEEIVGEVISDGYFVSEDVINECDDMYDDADVTKIISLLFVFNIIDIEKYKAKDIKTIRKKGSFHTCFRLFGDSGWLINLKPNKYGKFYENVDIAITRVRNRKQL